MEAYYDSEEEIAWGPPTLREIKADFNRPVLRLPNRRHTLVGSYLMNSSISDTDMLKSCSEDSTASGQDVASKVNTSETASEYYSPNESLKTGQNAGFLEKLSKVIDDPQTELSAYTSVLENSKTSVTTEAQSKNESFKSALSSELSNTCYLSLLDGNNIKDSFGDFFKVAEEDMTTYDIANFQQTLVENTVFVSDDERLNLDDSESKDSLHEEPKYENGHALLQKKTLSPKSENIIVISDEESLSSNNSISDEQDESFIIKKEISFKSQLYEETCDKERVEREKVSYRSRSSSGVASEDHYEDDSISDSDKSGPATHPNSEERESLTVSPITIPEIDLTQFDDSISKTDSPQFNDTLEEINRYLDQGTMSEEESIIEATPMKASKASQPDSSFKPCNIISSSFSQNQRHKTFSKTSEKVNRIPVKIPRQLASDTRQPNRINSMETTANTNFKIPVTPVRIKVNPTPPKSSSNHLKNIVSPVAMYIKNSPSVALKQNIPPKELSKIVSSKNSKSSSKENNPSFPEVEYKPAKKQMISKEKEITLPPSFKKLNIKESHLTKHEGRINQGLNKTKVKRKLLQNDITNNSIDASILNNSSDISILTNKQAYIK